MKKTTKKDKHAADFDIYFSVCRNCIFWLEDIENNGFGMCVRYAPRPYYAVYSTCAEAQEKREKGSMRWPETKASDGCGEWQSVAECKNPEVTDLREDDVPF